MFSVTNPSNLTIKQPFVDVLLISKLRNLINGGLHTKVTA